ncbi:assimilatory nitrate reductase catalytic subunit [Variovorax sp. HW608]|uniref:nitrate reductase n=1 Tax=Variovorax sp. HW608 TaxID=1034889 RepID=UPI0008200510|nr:nitrate reductase [Variovorax sp. HW608]SCK47969.1 assimilatory nitrate reductase catalytic subunit [Variovorax sp. HW608]
MKQTRSTCPYCGVGCGVIIESDGAQITGVRGDPEHPANFGRLCTKGSTLHLTASAAVTMQTRLLRPMQRATRGSMPEPIGWDGALDLAVEKFAQVIHDHGPDAVGFYVSGQLLTEDYYVFNKLAKGLVGTNNIDTNSRLCMSSAVAGYKKTLGADAPPACYDDLKHAQCLFITGSNTAWAHPILFRRIEDAKAANPAMKIIVADPRRTDTVEIADLFLPIQPGTDVMLFNGMLHLMLWEGWTDARYIAEHTNGFDALKATVRDCTPDRVAQVCGISKEDLLEAARLFATSPATLSLYCQGLNQSSSGTLKNAALINLHLATAQIGKPGAGPFSLTGQPNAMGGREVGGLANLLSAHRDLANPQHRAEVAAFWGVADVPGKPGKTAVEMFQAAADGEIRALWIACTNPAQSMPDQATVRRALERCEFVVVQEAFSTTATCAFADLLLPATTWGEKDGTVTNSERRISRVRPAVCAPGEARNDWVIGADFARRLEERLGRTQTLFPYDSPESVWNEHRETTEGRDLDITGMSYAMLEAGPQQWPLRRGETEGRARLYEDGIFPTPDGRARFVDTPYKPVAEAREARYPFSLNTGRLRDQWHGMSRTGTLGRLFGHAAEPTLQMHPQDMARRQIAEGDLVHVTSRRGSIVVPAAGSTEVGLSQAFIAMHWGGEYLSGSSSTGTPLAGVNALTTSSYCPDSKQPELKHAAVKILKAELPWSLLAAAWLPQASALEVAALLRELMRSFPFASCVPFGSGAALGGDGQERTGVLFRAAAYEAPPDALLAQIEKLLALGGPDTLRYADVRRGQRRTVRLVRSGTDAYLEGFLLGGDTRAEAWIKALLQDRLPAQSYGRQLLRPGAAAPGNVASKGKIICSCFGVTETAIAGQLAAAGGSDEERLAALQGSLKCGTNCGSCVPELKRMVRAGAPPAVAVVS